MHTQVWDCCPFWAYAWLQWEQLSRWGKCKSGYNKDVLDWKVDLLILQTIAPFNHTLPESEERRNVHQPEGMTEDELTALYFEQLDEQGSHSDPV